jgi:hypothetical protein
MRREGLMMLSRWEKKLQLFTHSNQTPRFPIRTKANTTTSKKLSYEKRWNTSSTFLDMHKKTDKTITPQAFTLSKNILIQNMQTNYLASGNLTIIRLELMKSKPCPAIILSTIKARKLKSY